MKKRFVMVLELMEPRLRLGRSRLKRGLDLGPLDQFSSAQPTELPGLLITHLVIAVSKVIGKGLVIPTIARRFTGARKIIRNISRENKYCWIVETNLRRPSIIIIFSRDSKLRCSCKRVASCTINSVFFKSLESTVASALTVFQKRKNVPVFLTICTQILLVKTSYTMQTQSKQDIVFCRIPH